MIWKLITILFGLCQCLSAQDSAKVYTQYHQVISVNPIKDVFIREVSIKVFCPGNKKITEQIFFNELDKVYDLQVKYSQNGNWKKLKKKAIHEQSINSSNNFYSGQKLMSFEIEVQDQAFELVYSYKKKTKGILFLSTIESNHNFKDFSTKIIVPQPFTISYNKKDSPELKVEISSEQSSTNYHFFHASNSNYKPLVKRILVHPKSVTAFDFLNDWYYELIQPQGILDQSTKEAFLSLTSNIDDELVKIKTVYEFVKKKIQYISLVNGLDAIRPRNVNQVWVNKQGDCKDMSLLLCQSLRYLGFNANLALSATVDHSFDFDFPSLSSTNHVICVIQYNDQFLYLDATEEQGVFGWPSMQIQNKHIFIINKNEGIVKKIPTISPEQNTVFYDIKFKQNGEKLLGEIKGQFQGLSRTQFNNSSTIISQVVTSYLKSKFSKCRLTNNKMNNHDTLFNFSAYIEYSNPFLKIKNKHFLPLDFIAFPHEDIRYINDSTVLHLNQTQYRKLEIQIELQTDFNLQNFKNVLFKKNGIHFEFNVKKIGIRNLKIDYLYRNEHIKISQELISTYNEVNELIREVLEKSVVYENRM